ncbi:PHB depolymerase family esterase [Acrocarpospora sp. B8E8]|uniref:extracellular catalytic domain type 1 short-chain-length polyhydroxyalkanoate depolymerase n=1 Tax=Acrocarpospora sp. B8E8 TaxID=3153572 RepID=UPI00325F60A3
MFTRMMAWLPDGFGIRTGATARAAAAAGTGPLRAWPSPGRPAATGAAAAVTAITMAVLMTGSARADSGATSTSPAPPTGQLQEIADFGPNPTGLRMHLYVPPRLGHRPAVLVVLHYCTGTGPAMFEATEYASMADRLGFVVVYPTAGRADGCFDVTSPEALRRGGGSDPVGITSMVRHVQRHLDTDRRRVFAAGFSSGAEMVNVLLATYPDVFAAGSVMAGTPVGCYTADDGGWNPNCENGGTIRTPRQWGDAVRAAYPGYTGSRPRVQLWHGTADEVLAYANFGEEIKQWTNVLHARWHGTDQPRPTWTRTRFADRFGHVVVEAYSIESGAHGIAFSEDGIEKYAIDFFGLARHPIR